MEMQQIMEMLAEMSADIRKSQAKSDAYRAEMKATHEEITAKLDAHQAKIDADREGNKK
jgi:hypothetical protein